MWHDDHPDNVSHRGEVDLGPASVLLHPPPHDDRDGTDPFTCPASWDDVEKRADREIVTLLISAWVRAEDRSRHPSRTGPDHVDQGATTSRPKRAFTLDDLIDSQFLLEDDAYIEGSLQSFV